MKKALTLIFILILTTICFGQKKEINSIFPSVDELHGGAQHWMSNINPVDTNSKCAIQSATYAYFASQAKPLFDIPRNNVYSVNIRFHVCESVTEASSLYEKLAKVGNDAQKKSMSLGDKASLYIEPSPRTELMGQYYLTGLNRYVVMQIHADDGFVLMDMGSMMNIRLTEYLSAGNTDISNAVTVKIEKEGYDTAVTNIPINSPDAVRIKLSGVLYDQHHNKIDNATITILETGAKLITKSAGEFSGIIGAKSGKEVSTSKVLTINKSPATHGIYNGYYATDILYKTNNAVGQDHWRINIDDNKIYGTSYSLKDGSILSFTGKIVDNTMTIERPCAGGVSKCLQIFEADLTDSGIVEGEWVGTGGGGQWRLYKNTFTEKSKIQTIREAKFNIKGTPGKAADTWEVVSGNKSMPIILKPSFDNANNFYLKAAKLKVDINSQSNTTTSLILSNDKNIMLIVSNDIELPKQKNAAIDITRIYKSKLSNSYSLNFSEYTDVVANIKPSIELIYAEPTTKAKAEGTAKASKPDMNGQDIAGNTKIIKPNSTPDIVIPISIAAYGTTLKGVEISALGKEKRQWNTYAGNIAPGVAVLDKDNTILNDDKGAISYKMENFTETLVLHLDRGSASAQNINGFLIILNFDNIKVNYEIRL